MQERKLQTSAMPASALNSFNVAIVSSMACCKTADEKFLAFESGSLIYDRSCLNF